MSEAHMGDVVKEVMDDLLEAGAPDVTEPTVEEMWPEPAAHSATHQRAPEPETEGVLIERLSNRVFEAVGERINDALNDTIDTAKESVLAEVQGLLAPITEKIEQYALNLDAKVAEIATAARNKVTAVVGEVKGVIADCRKEMTALQETHEKYRRHIDLAANRMIGFDQRVDQWDAKVTHLTNFCDGLIRLGITPETFSERFGKLAGKVGDYEEKQREFVEANRKAFDEIREVLREHEKCLRQIEPASGPKTS